MRDNKVTTKPKKSQVELLADLNPAQKAAVTHEKGPLLIVAGAGTGKTTVITRRVAHLILERGLKSEEILALTFTDKAAGEMEERVDRLLPYGYVELWISTFHAFAERILRTHAIEIGLPPDFKLLDTTEAWMLVRKNLTHFNLDYYRPLGNPTKFIHALLTHFSRAKDELISPKEYLEYVESIKLNTDSDLMTSGASVSGEARQAEIARLEEVANAYHVYEQLLLESSALDFGGLLVRTIELLRQRPRILEQYRNQFKYILVDEFQDTNIAQYELVKLLAAPKNNLTVVGDDDQCLPVGTKIALSDGERKIEEVRAGDEIITAVGKGYLWISRVSRVFKNIKQVRMLRIKLEDGHRLEVTDNHKMFCYVPRIDDGKRTYVYLMHSRLYGWRIGVTNDLATRLRLERGADKIVGLRSFADQDEARYYEMLWMLQYQIPPVCFKERDGSAIRGKWLEKLFKQVDTAANAQKLARNVCVDLSSHHYALDSVTRGLGRRIKIHFELCHRNYTVKQKSPRLLKSPHILHSVSLETSDLGIIQKLKVKRIPYRKAKKGIRICKTGTNLQELEQFANDLAVITGGFVEYSFKVGKRSTQTLEALAMPAGNLLVGHYLPVRRGNRVEYKKILDIEDLGTRNETVYDLEVEKTHNFIANNIVVHNSIYKFRGASISNILEFKKDFPQAKGIFLTENYRSKQNLLDLAYGFIKQNNPNRLEARLGEAGMTKKLVSRREGGGVIAPLRAETAYGEARLIAETILELKKKDSGASANDFAVLVRANEAAGLIIRALDEAGLPYELVARRGLYSKPIILDLLAYLRLLGDPYDNVSAYRVLTSPLFNLRDQDVSKIMYWARRRTWSILEVLRRAVALEFAAEAIKECDRVLSLIGKHASLARRESAGKIIFAILEDTGYLKMLVAEDEKNIEALRHLNQLYRKASDFEAHNSGATTGQFVEAVELEIEAGERGRLDYDPNEGPESVKVLTCHAAKGLEFKYVFISGLVDRRFPTIERKEQIEIPDPLVKEILTEGDIHLEEERRLFYVACTRAKDGLFFCSAEDYGGARKKKLSRFIVELQEQGFLSAESPKTDDRQVSSGQKMGQLAEIGASQFEISERAERRLASPQHFSYTQLKAFENCPLQYKFAHLLKIPARGRPTFSFGKTIHATLQKFCERMRIQQTNQQSSLFTDEDSNLKLKTSNLTIDELYKIYDECWIDDWFEDAHQKQQYYEKGRRILKQFYEQTQKEPPRPLYLEKSFNLKIDGYTLKGMIDRVDQKPDGTLEIIDYKTGRARSGRDPDKDQLYIYQLAAQEILGGNPSTLTYYYVEDGEKISFIGTSEDLEKLKNKIKNRIKEMQTSSFPATPSKEKCQHCDFRNICEFRIL